MPQVSIILTTYNSGEHIWATLDSVWEQTFTDFELIVIDDGSTDGTAARVQEVSEPRLTVHAYANAGVNGPSASRNRGLTHAQGEFVAFLNHDDVWHPNKLKDQLSALQENPQAMVAYSWLDHIDGEGNFLHQGSRCTAFGYAHNALLGGNFIETGSNPLIRRAALDIVGEFDPDFTLTADWEMWLRLSQQFELVCVPKVAILFRSLPNALSANTTKMEQAGLKLIDHAFLLAPRDANANKSRTIAYFYEYLASRTLKGAGCSKKAKLARRFLRDGIKMYPRMIISKPQRIVRICIKSAAFSFLPTRFIRI